MLPRFSSAVLSLALLLGLSVHRANAQTLWIDPGADDWFDAANWDAGVPDAATNAQINNGGTAQIAAAGALANQTSLGNGLGESGTLEVTGVGDLTNSSFLFVGNFGTGTLTIQAGGQVSDTVGRIGNFVGSTGTVTVDGTGSMWTHTFSLTVGNFGTGTLNIQNGGTVSNTFTNIGDSTGSMGTVTVDGMTSTWTNSSSLSVGSDGTGILNIQNGGTVSNTDGRVGRTATGTATVDGVGSMWTNSGGFTVGLLAGSTGTLNIQNGGTVSNAAGRIGDNTGSSGTVTVDGTGSLWDNSGDFTVGRSGTGTLTIQNGGTVSNTLGSVGDSAGAMGTVTVDGIGSMWTNSSFLTVGDAGMGTLTIQNSGVVSNTDGFIGANAGSDGTVTIDGVGSQWMNSGDVYVGGNAGGAGGTGLLRINNGGVASANSVTVYSTGTLTGDGTVMSNVMNGGLVQPGNGGAGTLNITGNFTQMSGGTLEIDVASSTSFDLLAIGGAANLDGTLRVITLGGFVPSTTDMFTIITAGGGVSGTFATLDQTMSTVVFDVTYNPNSVVLTFVATQFEAFFEEIARRFSEFALTPNQNAVAGALDRSSSDSRQRKLIDYLLSRDIDKLPGDFDRIAPEELAALFEFVFAGSNAQNFNVQNRLENARGGATGFQGTANFTSNDGTIDLRGLSLRHGTGTGVEVMGGVGYYVDRESKGGKDVFTPSPENRWGVWATGNGDFVDVDDDFNARGFDFRSGGVSIGADYRVSESLILGLAGSYTRTEADLAQGGDAEADGGRLALYGTWFRGGAYLNTLAGVGYNSFDTRRRSVGGFASGETDGWAFDGLLGGGYDFTPGNWKFGPTASLAYTHVGVDGYKERGSLAPLRIEEMEDDSLRSRLGGRVAYAIETGSMKITPSFRAEWQHEFLDDNRAVTARFGNGAGGPFTVESPGTGADAVILGAGLDFEFDESYAMFLGYEAELGRDNYSRHSANVGFRVSF